MVVCPLADPSLVAGLTLRGYRLSHFENILAMRLDDSSDGETQRAPGIVVRPVASGEAELYARVVAANFVGPDEPIEPMIEMATMMLGIEECASFLAIIDGEPVGGGAVFMHRRLALFAGAATLPPYRNRGVHAALHHARLAFARDAGFDLAAQGGGLRQHFASCNAAGAPGAAGGWRRRLLFNREPARHSSSTYAVVASGSSLAKDRLASSTALKISQYSSSRMTSSCFSISGAA